MTRLAFALLTVAALGCGGKNKPPATTGTTAGSAGPAPVARKITVGWGAEVVGDHSDVFLALTDETGKSVSHALGRWKGTCAPHTPAPEMKALTGMLCRAGGSGTELHAVTQGGAQIIVLYMRFDEGVAGDPMSREEVKRISVPLGVAIEAAP